MINTSIQGLKFKLPLCSRLKIIRSLCSKVLEQQKPQTECKTEKAQSKSASNKSKKMFDGKVALITGGAHGIGFAIAKEFLKNGMKALTIADLDAKAGCSCIEQLTREFGEDRVLFIECDVADCNALDWALKKTVEYHNDLNIVVNNAGVMDDIRWDQQLKINLGGVLAGTLLGMQYMAKSCNGKGGIVVNLASIMSLIPSSGCPVHTMTQFGIIGFSRALGCKTHFRRTGVKIVAYCPGLTDTKITDKAIQNAINENFAKEFKDETKDCELQAPESVAKGIVSIMNRAASGSVWVSECNEPPFEVNFPKVKELKKNDTKHKNEKKLKHPPE